jgi:hypothetical protein
MNLNNLSPALKTEILESLRALPKNQRRLSMQIVESTPLDTPCSTCANFGTGGYCEQWKAEVPKENQQAGCNCWLDEIPF